MNIQSSNNDGKNEEPTVEQLYDDSKYNKKKRKMKYKRFRTFPLSYSI